MQQESPLIGYRDLIRAIELDGSLLDIYAFDTTVDDWNRLLALAPSLAEVTYYCDGDEAPPPPTANALLEDNDLGHLLEFNLGGLRIKTNFFAADEIELYVDPADIASQAALDLLLNFCAAIGRGIKRDIRITQENCPQYGCLIYVADQDRWSRQY